MKKREQKRTAPSPVEDGDTRPDMQPAGDVGKTSAASDETGSRVTKERGADTNSLEDYKDAKGNIASTDYRDERMEENTSVVPKPEQEN